MPDIGFVLPHWLYWSGLVIFPLVAMVLARRVQPQPGSRTIGIAYFIWLVGGFFGFHRLYLKNKWGMLYWPLFAIILFTSSMEREVRVVYSDAVAAVKAIDSSANRTQRRLDKATVALVDANQRISEVANETQSIRDRAQRAVDKQSGRVSDAETKLVDLAAERVQVLPKIEETAAERKWWSSLAFNTFLAILAFMVVDFFLMPRMLRKARAYLEEHPDDRVEREILADDREFVGKGIAGIIDRISLFTGEFVALWSVIAVFVYYYEVIVRYVFNSPTNWAHEGMFLMFGMQYLIAGSYAMLTESHVRVDIFYASFSPRGKAIVDLATSVFFFIFAFTLLWTGWIFAADSVRQGEVSFTEWAIQYWPIKITIVIGGALLLLQGLSKLSKDISLIVNPAREMPNGS
jgi:TRAP-type mannitol/chloroaromatic compound transport system permease small subunit